MSTSSEAPPARSSALRRTWGRWPRSYRAVLTEVLVWSATALEVLPFGLPGDPLLDLSVLALFLALPVRLVAPEVAVVLAALGTSWAFSLVAPAVVVARLAYRRDSGRWVLLWCGVGTAVAVAPFWATGPGAAQINLTSVATAAAVYGGGAAIGRLRRSRGEQRAAYARLERSLEVQRRLAADTARAEERAAMSREMHDVVSHHISLIALQAGALRAAPAPADVVVATAETIRRLSVQANTELRHLLSALRDTRAAEAAGTCHGLEDLDCLVATAGLTARLVVEGDTVCVPPTVQGACYRAVQEGLANAGKHAPGGTVEVHCRVADSEVTCTITNASPCRPPSGELSGGQGLTGLRERVGVLGGRLEAGPRPDGGWRLQVVLPLVGGVRRGSTDGVLPG